MHFSTIKSLDEAAVVAAAQKCGRVVTAEEGQIAGGFGSAVAEVLSEKLPVKIKRIGVCDQFGESGSVTELWKKHGLDVEAIVRQIKRDGLRQTGAVDSIPGGGRFGQRGGHKI